MTSSDYPTLVARQREYFLSGPTRPKSWRKAQLVAVKALFTENHDELCDALWKDLRRNVIDADLMDVTYCGKEADYALKHLDAWMEPHHAPMPLVFEPGHIRVRRDPLGVTLIIGAWNEPFMLTFGPLAAALAAGNTAVLKPSEIAASCAAAAARLVPKYFDPRAVAVVEGGIPETTALLEQQWDFIFFTGSPAVGKIVHQAAAKHLTPCVLELGGKNPTIVHSSAKLKVAARRIAYGRFMNSGHICTAPDHVLVWPEVKDEFVAASWSKPFANSTATIRRKAPTTGASSTAANFDRLADCSERQDRGRRPERRDRTLYRPDRASGCFARFTHHAGGSLRPDPAGARNRSRSTRSSSGSTAGPARSASTCSPKTSMWSSEFWTLPRQATRRLMTVPSTHSFPSFHSVA